MLVSSITKQQIDVYLPDPDRTYSSRNGICYDYASLMCAMLRSQGIPSRLIKGSTPLGYHAWNEVFFEGRGWVVVAAFPLEGDRRCRLGHAGQHLRGQRHESGEDPQHHPHQAENLLTEPLNRFGGR